MNPLDSEEIEILEAFEKGELKKTANAAQEIERHKAIAEATFKQDVLLNISLSSRDLRSLQIRALQEGIPCQALVSSILHKFVDGRLVEKGFDKSPARQE
jgi:predicted DNA binding CopG/RHH family protein